MEEENKKPENVPINPDIVVKGNPTIRSSSYYKERLEELISTGMTEEEAHLKIIKDLRNTSEPLIYKSGSGCMVALLIIIAPTILLSLLIF